MDTEDPGPILSDGELLRLAAAGNKEAFGDFCTRTLPTLSRVATATCRRFNLAEEYAEDAVQDTILSALTRTSQGYMDINLGYLVVSIQNKIIDYVRKEHSSKRKHIDLNSVEIREQDPEVDQDRFADLLARFELLSSADRDLLESVFLLNLTPAAIAKRLGVSKWAVYKRIERLLSSMKNM
jgi:RNA polymerase sigma factor (sigma-70 family)